MDDVSESVMVAAAPVDPGSLVSTVDGGLPADQLHITLVYLGDIASTFAMFAIREELQIMALLVPPITVTFETVDLFGPDNGQDAIVMRVAPSAELVGLHTYVLGMLNLYGYKDASSFDEWLPHLTVGYATPGTVEHEALVAHARGLVGLSVPLAGVDLAVGVGWHHFEFNGKKVAVMACGCETEVCACDANARALVAAFESGAPEVAELVADFGVYVPLKGYEHTASIVRDAAAALALRPKVDYAALAALIPVDDVDPAYFMPPMDMLASTKMSVALDEPLPGHLYGVVAPRGRCLLDGTQACWTVDDLERDDPNLEFVHQGDVRLTDGSMLKISALAGDVGHAPRDLSPEQARDWMGATSMQIGRVRFQYTAAGLVAAGVVWPEVVANQRIVAELRASPTSLDARWMAAVAHFKELGHYALCGAVFVNTPGLPIARVGSIDPWMSSWAPSNTVVDGRFVKLVDDTFTVSFNGTDMSIDREPMTAAADPGQSTSTPPQVKADPPPADPAVNPAALPAPVDPRLLERITTLEGTVNLLKQMVDSLAQAEMVRQDDAMQQMLNDMYPRRLDGLAADVIV